MLDGGRIGPSPGHDYAQSYPLGGIPCRSAQTGHDASALRCCLDGSRRHPGTVSGTRSPAPDPRLEPPARSAFAARSYPGLSSVVIGRQDGVLGNATGETGVSVAVFTSWQRLSLPVNGATSGIRTPNPRFTKAVPETRAPPATCIRRLPTFHRVFCVPQAGPSRPRLRQPFAPHSDVVTSVPKCAFHSRTAASLCPTPHSASALTTNRQGLDYPLRPPLPSATMAVEVPNLDW